MKKSILLSVFAFAVSNLATAGSTNAMSNDEHAMSDMSANHQAMMATPTRTINVSATDNMSFTPTNWAIKQGEVIRFVVTNSGKMAHEFVVGNSSEMREHKQMMKVMPDMAHDDGNAISLAPGETRELVLPFTYSGDFEVACNVPGHYEAGMKSDFQVKAG
ncbi:MAG: cupredoxin family protein [Pseudomonadales bacterium]|nr:cupredoxin family protein [Pseudomonadales bacterium]NRA17036.1 cupredoxin family protein [Oceanospirillaceae bacterium]